MLPPDQDFLMRRHTRTALSSALLLAGAACANPNVMAGISDEALAKVAGPIHERVMTLDTHVDFDPGSFAPGQLNYAQRLNTQVDLTKMEEGGLDAAFFSIYV